jgi:hypothetical protein
MTELFALTLIVCFAGQPACVVSTGNPHLLETCKAIEAEFVLLSRPDTAVLANCQVANPEYVMTLKLVGPDEGA